MASIALLITTYNRPATLDWVLGLASFQTRIPDEIIVADDGSTPETKEIISRWGQKLPLKHSWMPDSGFRAARSRNLAILKTSSDYIVMLDGDCLMPPCFIEKHMQLAESGHLVSGGRYLYSEEDTDCLLNGPFNISELTFNSPKFFSLPLGPLRNLAPRAWKMVRTCNLGVWRSDVLKVGGFDEAFVGWGREDSDLAIRLLQLGIKIKSARFAACVGHLYHPEESMENLLENQKLLECSSDRALHDFNLVNSCLAEL